MQVKMRIKNTQNHYGLITIFLHWTMVVLIIGLIILGLVMVDLPIGLKKLRYFGWHKEYGMLALLIGLLRFVWRLSNRTPALPVSIPVWQKHSAHFVHWMFYVYMLLMPVTGWILTSAAGLPVSFFGLFVFPDLVSPSKNLMNTMILTHELMGYALIGAILLHTSAAFLHHFYYKDNVLRGMIK